MVVTTGAGGCAANGRAPSRVASDPSWSVVSGVKLVPAKAKSDCGLAALQTVVGYWKPDLKLSSLPGATPPTAADAEQGLQAGELKRVAERAGFQAFIVEAQVSDLAYEISQGRPVIIGVISGVAPAAAEAMESARSEPHQQQEQQRQRHQQPKGFGHYEVVTGFSRTRDRLLIADPRGSWKQIDTHTLLAEWRPARQLALMILPQPQGAVK